MNPPLVRDVMTVEVVTAEPATDFKTVARRMAEHQVNQLPVVDPGNRVVGVVSEADLLAKTEWAGRERPGRVERWLLEQDIEKAAALTAADVMTEGVVTVGPDIPVREAAHNMRLWGRKALPVVDAQGLLVGIVSRADLLRSFVRPDHEIAADIVAEVLTEALSLDPSSVQVTVAEGVVTLTGKVESESLRRMVETMVARVPGVVAVADEMEAGFDDSKPYPEGHEPADNLTYTGPPLH